MQTARGCQRCHWPPPVRVPCPPWHPCCPSPTARPSLLTPCAAPCPCSAPRVHTPPSACCAVSLSSAQCQCPSGLRLGWITPCPDAACSLCVLSVAMLSAPLQPSAVLLPVRVSRRDTHAGSVRLPTVPVAPSSARASRPLGDRADPCHCARLAPRSLPAARCPCSSPRVPRAHCSTPRAAANTASGAWW